MRPSVWFLGQAIVALGGGLLAGLLTGWLTLGRVAQPPEKAPIFAGTIAPPAPTTLPAVPTETVSAKELLAEPPKPKKIAEKVQPLPQNSPDVVEEKRLEGDPTLLLRGPGHTALLDLEAAGMKSLQVREGSLTRDGAANWNHFAKKPRVATLLGPQARVELLHLGLDAEARPILAHVRTVDASRVEGIVPLLNGDVRLPVLADPDPPTLAPPPEKAPAEDDGAPQE